VKLGESLEPPRRAALRDDLVAVMKPRSVSGDDTMDVALDYLK
jgi:hypothetical protein